MSYIKKEDALAAVMSVWKDADYDAHPLSEVYDRIARLPVFEPYQKTGIWNWKGNGDNYDMLQCGVCGEIVHGDLDQAYKYCPHCGAEMITDEEAVTAEFWAEVERKVQYLLWRSRKEVELLKREEGE